MIAACPTCGARYRIDPAKLGAEGARLRCSRCENVFRVRPPEAGGPAAEARTSGPVTPQPAAPARPAPAAAAARTAPAARAEAAPAADPARLVLIAHPERDAGKQIADALSRWGVRVIVVHDGVEAILNIQRTLPRVVVLDAALPKMFGFQVCELMKRNESLRSIHVVLVGAIHDQDRYRRPPGELYGADAYAERQTLPDALRPLLERFGVPLQPEDSAAAPAARAEAPVETLAPPAPRAAPPREAPRATPAAARATPVAAKPAVVKPAPAPPGPAPAAAAPAARDEALAQEQAQADRLARIIVSDIVLYNPEKFEEGLRSGRLVASLEAELAEGRALFAQRIDPRVGSAETFLERELMRVARARSER
jgi:predicted Zn finger-like uncharacterized protein